MIVTITGAVTVGGQVIPVSTQVTLPDTVREVPQETKPSKGNQNPFYVVPQAS